MGGVNLRLITWVLAGLMSQPSCSFFHLEEQEGEKYMSGHPGQLSVNNSTNVWSSNSIGWFKIKYMISCIPTHIPLVYKGILKYRLGFGFHTPQAWWEPWECKKSIKTTSSWNLKLPEVVGHSFSRWNYRLGTLSRRLFFQCVPSGIVLNALSVVTVCQCDLQLLNAITTFLCGMESWPECADVLRK